MKKAFVTSLAGVAAVIALPTVAVAQSWVPGSEIAGQAVQVETNGVINTVHFDPGGTARIVSPGGSVVQGTWSAASGQLCLNVAGSTECWPYTQAFQAGQAIQLTSSCQVASTWVAQNTNPPPQVGGERG